MTGISFRYLADRRGDHSPENAPVVSLTARQKDSVWCASQGLKAKEIAAELGITPATVRVHLANARRALGCRTTCHTVAQALRAGLID